MAGRIPRGQEGRELIRLLLLFVSIFLQHLLTLEAPESRVTLHLKLLLVYKIFEHDRITPSQVNCFASFNNFIM